MRAYRVRHDMIGCKFVGSEAEARKLRQTWFEANEKKVKRNDIVIAMIEVPTSKAELLQWLNETLGS